MELAPIAYATPAEQQAELRQKVEEMEAELAHKTQMIWNYASKLKQSLEAKTREAEKLEDEKHSLSKDLQRSNAECGRLRKKLTKRTANSSISFDSYGDFKHSNQATPPLFPEEYEEKAESLVRAKKKLESEFVQMKRVYTKEKCTLESTIFSLREQLKQLRRQAAPAYSQYLQVFNDNDMYRNMKEMQKHLVQKDQRIGTLSQDRDQQKRNATILGRNFERKAKEARELKIQKQELEAIVSRLKNERRNERKVREAKHKENVKACVKRKPGKHPETPPKKKQKKNRRRTRKQIKAAKERVAKPVKVILHLATSSKNLKVSREFPEDGFRKEIETAFPPLAKQAYRIMFMNGNYDVDDADDWKEVLDDYNDVDPIKIRIENVSEAILKQYTVDISAPSSNGEDYRVVKKETEPTTINIPNILSSIKSEIEYVEKANEVFMDTIFIYENLPLKNMKKLLEKAQKLASKANLSQNKRNLMELRSIRDNVSMLAKQVHAACDLGIKREDLVVDKNQKSVEVEISREELFNVLHPTYGYMATKDAIQIMNRGRKRIKKQFINGNALSHLSKSDQKKAMKALENQIRTVVPKIIQAGNIEKELKFGVCKKKSRVCDGFGLFATKDFQIATIIGLFLGKLMTEEEAQFYYGPGTRQRERACYICSLAVGKETLIIDPHNLSSRVNHAGKLGDSTPVNTENMAWIEIIYQGVPYLAEVVIRNIKAGQEILTNYGEFYRPDPFLDPLTHPKTLKCKAVKLYTDSRSIDLTAKTKMPPLEADV